jgi:hypothetical protein
MLLSTELAVLAVLSLVPVLPVELHAASPPASKPASSTLFPIRFMIHSF